MWENMMQWAGSTSLSSLVQVQASHPARSCRRRSGRFSSQLEFRLRYLARSLTLLVVRGGDLDVQQGGVGPGLVHLGVRGVYMSGHYDGVPTL